MSAAIGSGEGVYLVDHEEAQIPEQLGDRDARRHEHDLERLGRGHEQLTGLSREGLLLGLSGIAVPHEAMHTDHFGVFAETDLLIVEQRFDGCDVNGADAPRRVDEHRSQDGEHRRLGLASRCWGQNDGVLAVENGRSCELLNQTERGEPARRNGVLQALGETGEDTHRSRLTCRRLRRRSRRREGAHRAYVPREPPSLGRSAPGG